MAPPGVRPLAFVPATAPAPYPPGPPWAPYPGPAPAPGDIPGPASVRAARGGRIRAALCGVLPWPGPRPRLPWGGSRDARGGPFSGPVMHGGGGIPAAAALGAALTGGPWPWVISKNLGPCPESNRGRLGGGVHTTGGGPAGPRRLPRRPRRRLWCLGPGCLPWGPWGPWASPWGPWRRAWRRRSPWGRRRPWPGRP